MSVNYEHISDRVFYEYEKLFFEEICLLDTQGRDSFDTALPEPLERIHFACVQDTAERLTELTGRLSTFQWRNCLFVPIDKNIRPKDIYEEVYEQLKQTCPSLFIRSYVYVIFIKVYGAGALDLGVGIDETSVSKDDMQIYVWNTNYDIKPQGKADLFNLASSKEAREEHGTRIGFKASKKAFIVANPDKELQRIQDANSDVIDAVRAFYGDLDLIKQTEEHLRKIENALSHTGSRVLVEGPARSGKTIIAMSLLASNPSAKMLIMNWYFYDALKDAFRVWANLDEGQIANLFETDVSTQNMLDMRDVDEDLLKIRTQHERILVELSKLWTAQAEGKSVTDGISCWRKVQDDWLVTNPKGKKPGELILVEGSNGSIQVRIVENSFSKDPKGFVRTSPIMGVENKYKSFFTEWRKNDPISTEEARKRSEHLINLEMSISGPSAAELAAKRLKGIADALDSTKQRFFHHDRRPEYRRRGGVHYFVSVQGMLYGGYWELRVSDGCTLICDEAQRLWDEEAEFVTSRSGATFLCGDDNQRLNRRGDRGMGRLWEAPSLNRFELPDSVGIPAEIGILVKAMLAEAPIPEVLSSFNIKLIHNDDIALVREFEKDSSAKKHYAIPVSTGFLPPDYVPAIKKTVGVTNDCSNECSEYCLHRYIRMISPISDPKQLKQKEDRKDLSRNYKFFCAEAIMPNYALSAYELISREVESVYLKIPSKIGKKVLEAPIDGDQSDESWIKRHLYVLMTRATTNLVINVEDKYLYDHFKRVCEQAGLNCNIN